MTTAVEVHQGNGIDRAAVLRAVGINVNDPNAQALLLVCERYGLDPLLKHMVLIQGRPYVTRDGYLHIAHTSKVLDGIEIVDEGEDDNDWWARVSVYRKDMGRPFTYKGRYPKSGSNKTYGPEMALKCAEVAALRRAFNVTGIGAADEAWDQGEPVDPGAELAVREDLDAVMTRVAALTEDDQVTFLAWKADQRFEWHPGYSVADLAAIDSKLTEITGPEGAAVEASSATDLETGEGSAASEGASSPETLPDASEEEAFALTPCAFCGSTRAKRARSGEHVRCIDTKGCENRAQEPM